MSWIATYLQYFVVYLLAVLAFYSIGKLIVLIYARFCRAPDWYGYVDLFGSFIIGTVTVVAAFSLILTHGRSVNLLVPIVAVAFLLWLRNESKASSNLSFLPKLTSLQYFEFFLYAWGIYTFFALGIIRNHDWSSFLDVPHPEDWGFYSVNMQTMLQTGQENFFHVFNLLSPDYHGMAPYHYFEMWMAGILKTLFPGLLPMYLFSVVTYPLCLLIALAGSWALLECVMQPGRYHRALALLCFFGSGLFIFNASSIRIQNWIQLLTGNLTSHFLLFLPKRIISYVWLLASVLLFLNKKERASLVCLMMLPVVSVDLLPATLGGVFLYGIAALRKGWQSRKHVLLLWLTTFAFAVAFLLVYRAFGNNKIQLYSPIDAILQPVSLSPNAYLIPFIFLMRGILQVAILYSPHLLILYFLMRERNDSLSKMLMLVSCMLLCALAGWSVFYSYFDSIQLLTGFLAIFQTLILTAGLVLLGKARSPLLRSFLVAYLIAGSLFNAYAYYFPRSPHRAALPFSQVYLDTVVKLTPRSRIGISIQSREGFKSWGFRNVMTQSIGVNYLVYMPQYLKSVEVGIFNIPETPFRNRPKKIPFLNLTVDLDPIDAYRSRLMKESSLFYRYYEQMKLKNPNVTVEEAQVALIDDYNIDWGIASKGTESFSLLKERVAFQVTDKVSGETFMLLRTRSGAQPVEPQPVR